MFYLLKAVAITTGAVLLTYYRLGFKSIAKSTSQGYILRNKITHARFSPTSAHHVFTYPALFFLVSLNALESHSLDLGRGWVFGYNRMYGRLTGLRPSAYLMEGGNGDIQTKLKHLLSQRGCDAKKLKDVWMLTMPGYLGFEGINPLTVYFLYTADNEAWGVLLEIHNTFGERHVHILHVNEAESLVAGSGFTHAWTIRRQFHVSPFNDRSGYYAVSVNVPPAPATVGSTSYAQIKPHVRIQLHSAASEGDSSTVGPLKLSAVLRTSSSLSLSSRNLLISLLLQPFILLLSTPRILYQAWILHYRKRLDVHTRPEPYPASPHWGSGDLIGDGVGWQCETWAKSFARKRVLSFLQHRANDTGIYIVLVSGDPATPQIQVCPCTKDAAVQTLKISYTSSAFFSALFTAPSMAHAMLMCDSAGLVHLSRKDPARQVFQPPPPPASMGERRSLAQWLRRWQIPSHLRGRGPGIPTRHPLDCPGCDIVGTLVLLYGFMLEWFEEVAYKATRTRFVAGQEPWKKWDRALTRNDRLEEEIE